MGTSTKRSSANDDYYKQGGVVIPGVQVRSYTSRRTMRETAVRGGAQQRLCVAASPVLDCKRPCRAALSILVPIITPAPPSPLG